MGILSQHARLRAARRWITGCIAVALLLVPLAANAHYVYNRGVVWEVDGKCIRNRTEISHGRNRTGYMAVRAGAWQEDPSPFHCPQRWSRPAGYIKVKFHFMKWVSGYGWAQCFDSAWRKNRSVGSEFELYHHVSKDGPICGAAWYAVYGRTRVKHNGNWHGGALWAKKHFLPCQAHGTPPCPARTTPPEAAMTQESEAETGTNGGAYEGGFYAPDPVWLAPNGEVDASKFPSEGIARVGANGAIIGRISLAEFNSGAEGSSATSYVKDGVEYLELP